MNRSIPESDKIPIVQGNSGERRVALLSAKSSGNPPSITKMIARTSGTKPAPKSRKVSISYPSDTPIFVVIGPSGCGKSTLVRILVERGVVSVSPSWTDRPVRDESEIEHVFVSSASFTREMKRGTFLEVVQPFGLQYRYGLPPITAEPGLIPTILLRAEFIPMLHAYYPKHLIYQIEAPEQFARNSLLSRREPLGTRLDRHASETSIGRDSADRIFVNDMGISPDLLAQHIEQQLMEDWKKLSRSKK